MSRMGVRAVSLDKETVREAHRKGKNLLKEVEQGKWSVIIVSPERLNSPEFEKILRSERFRKLLALYVIDEAHVILPWAADFRDAYGRINRVIARIPGGVPVLAMSGTLSFEAEAALIKFLGYREGTYQTVRMPCERPNLRVVFSTLTHGLGGKDFPDIAWATKGNKKIIIFCDTIDLGFRVATYLRRFSSPGPSRLRRIRTYNSLIWPKDNAECLRAFREDEETRIVVSTVKIAMGVDLRQVDIVINLGAPASVAATMQQICRAGRDPSRNATGYTYVEASVLELATSGGQRRTGKSRKDGNSSDSEMGHATKTRASAKMHMKSTDDMDLVMNTKKNNRKTHDEDMLNLIKCHAKNSCLVAELNRVFGSSHAASHEACIKARRRLPCSSCMRQLVPRTRMGKYKSATSGVPTSTNLNVPPSNAPGDDTQPTAPASVQPVSHSTSSTVDIASSTDTPADESPSHTDGTAVLPDMSNSLSHGSAVPSTLTSSSSATIARQKLTVKLRNHASKVLDSIYLAGWMKKEGPRYSLAPYGCFMPRARHEAILDNFHLIESSEDLRRHLDGWEFWESDRKELWEGMRGLNARYDRVRAEWKRQAVARQAQTLQEKTAVKTSGVTGT